MPRSTDILPKSATRQRLALAAAMTMLAAGSCDAATAGGQAYYERALMQAADGRCHLFSPQLGSALAAAAAQARGAALRAGATNKGLAILAVQAAAKQAGLPCGAKDLAVAAAWTARMARPLLVAPALSAAPRAWAAAAARAEPSCGENRWQRASAACIRARS